MRRPDAAAPTSATAHEALLDALRAATDHNRSDGVAPAAVLWTDRERYWEPAIPRLRGGLPLLTLGTYAPEALTGPAIWLRCVIAGTLPELELPEGTPVIYLPGVSRADLRAVEDCPRELQPLAELQYRGILFSHPNGRDWTPAAFLQGRLGIGVAGDASTRAALVRALPKVLDEPVEALATHAPLTAADLNALLVPDPERELLLWLDDPEGHDKAKDPAARAAFRSLCVSRYGLDPDADGALGAARLLAEGKGAWRKAWSRYADAPKRYPNLPALLDRASPPKNLKLFEPSSPYYPRDNRAEEDNLREALLALSGFTASEARKELSALEARHGERRGWVWADLGQSPLALALLSLGRLAEATAKPLGAGTPAELAERYVSEGWKADRAALDALAATAGAADFAAVRTAVRAVYAEWLEGCALRFQEAVAAEPLPVPEGLEPDGPETGRCLLFTDGLRYDVALRLAELLEARDAGVEKAWRYGALPGVTSTAKPTLSPARPLLSPGSKLDATAGGKAVTAESLRRLLKDQGYQILKGEEVGSPEGSAWTEMGDLDALGHGRGCRMAFDVERSLRDLASRVETLLEAGWREVRVVTDHGWLLLPGGLPKVGLPEHLTVVRKGRCARLKSDA
ncbi:MAG: BREX-1 system phosphatase PglZ type B, partial [Actinomycetota bacterium]|nr:BREX-1 system phosphatase PglZ type B [Actinomycetota bacterium]